MLPLQLLHTMALASFPALQFKSPGIFGTPFQSFRFRNVQNTNVGMKTIMAKARANTRTESTKIRNRRMQKKFNGTPAKPRLSVFCSSKQLYAMLVDDKNKKCLFYGSTLQKSVRGSPPRNTMEAAECVGEELIKACIDLKISEISSYDCNGFACGERMQAFEIAIARHGFLLR